MLLPMRHSKHRKRQMQRGKEILIFLLFVIFSFLVWWIRSIHSSSASQAEQQVSERQEDETDVFTEKRLEIAVEVLDVPRDKRVRVFPSHVTVYARVKIGDYERITAQSLKLWCSYPTRAAQYLPLHADVTDARILNVRIDPDKVEYIIEQE